MSDLEHLNEIRRNYGNNIIGYRCIRLPEDEDFNKIRREFDLVNELFANSRHQKLKLSDLAPLRDYDWNEAERRRLLSRMRNPKVPLMPLDISITSHNADSIISRRLGWFAMEIPLQQEIGQGFLVRAGNHHPKSFYFAYSLSKSKRRAVKCDGDVQQGSVRFSQVQPSIGNSLAA
jgi:hypothetical protein